MPVIGGHSGVTILPLLSQIPGVSFTEQEVADLTRRIELRHRSGGSEGGWRFCNPVYGQAAHVSACLWSARAGRERRG
ncbi:MAG: hypothetical protein ACLR9W_03615 [Enterobacter hormaechei]